MTRRWFQSSRFPWKLWSFDGTVRLHEPHMEDYRAGKPSGFTSVSGVMGQVPEPREISAAAAERVFEEYGAKAVPA